MCVNCEMWSFGGAVIMVIRVSRIHDSFIVNATKSVIIFEILSNNKDEESY